MSSVLLCIKVKDAKDQDLFADTYIFYNLTTEDYELIDVFADEKKNKLYYYFNFKKKLTDTILVELYHKLKSLLPNVIYISLLPEKIH
jgi:hypothetical protein